MGNNGNCDVCAGNARSQMDMRRQKAAMYDRYTRGQMMPRTQSGCSECGTSRMTAGCDSCGDARITKSCDTCGNARINNSCNDCGKSERDELRGMPLAMGYVPWQNFECTYEPMQGLRAGTIFPELDKPFYGRRGMR